MSDPKEIQKSLSSDATTAIVVGSQVFVSALSADGKPFVFTRDQMEFFLALKKLKAVQPAALSVGKDEAWANKFLASRKFKSFIAAKMQELQIKSGITVEWWYQFGKHLATGYRDFYVGTCGKCLKVQEYSTYEIEAARDDDMEIHATCPDCLEPVQVSRHSEAFRATREMVEGWKELGSRLIPKIERVQHEYDKTEISFETESA